MSSLAAHTCLSLLCLLLLFFRMSRDENRGSGVCFVRGSACATNSAAYACPGISGGVAAVSLLLFYSLQA